MHKILCLDLGTTTGWAFHNKGDVTHGIKKFPKDLGQRLEEYYNWLRTLDTDEVIYEKSFNVPGHANLTLNAMAGILILVATQRDWGISSVSPMTIKKAVTGTGRATKEDMVEYVQKRYPEVTDHNEADAIGIWLWCSEAE
jgi:Holliday junction resolvasome RuvABC endonuclease subunit